MSDFSKTFHNRCHFYAGKNFKLKDGNWIGRKNRWEILFYSVPECCPKVVPTFSCVRRYVLLHSALRSAYVPSGPIAFLSEPSVLLSSGATFCYVPPAPIVFLSGPYVLLRSGATFCYVLPAPVVFSKAFKDATFCYVLALCSATFCLGL